MNKSSIQIHNCYHLNNFRNEIKTAPKTTRSKQKPSKNISKRIKEEKKQTNRLHFFPSHKYSSFEDKYRKKSQKKRIDRKKSVPRARVEKFQTKRQYSKLSKNISEQTASSIKKRDTKESKMSVY